MRLRILAVLILGGCNQPPATQNGFCATCEGADHPLNQVMLPAFEAAQHEPIMASGRELCARFRASSPSRRVAEVSSFARFNPAHNAPTSC